MKKAWKQILPIVLCLLLLLTCLSSCGGTEDPAESDPASAEASAETSDETTSEGDTTESVPETDTSAESGAEAPVASDPAVSDAPAVSEGDAPGASQTPDSSNNEDKGNTTQTTVGNVKESTVKVDGLTVHSVQTPYVSGGQLPIRILMPYPQESANMDKQAFTAYYEKMSGMRATYNFYIGSDIFVLTQTMMNSGNLPDIFMSVPVGFACAKVAKYGKEGYFADLTNKLQTWAPNAYKAINSKEHPYAKAISYAPGKVYSLPTIFPTESEGGSVNLMEERQLMINMAWLDELGLDVPETTDDLYEVAKAFTEEDPDGNGKDDTFGFGINLWTPQLWNPWGLAMSWYYTGTVTEKGEVLSGLLTDNFREGCRFYNRLWNEGIFNKQMIGSEGSTLNSMIHKTGIVSMSWVSSYLSDSELKDWSAIAWPKGKNTGDLLAGISQPGQLDSYENMIFVSAKTKSVEACLRWIDYFYTNEGAMLWHYGPEGVAYTKVGSKYKLKANVGTLAANQKVLCSYSPMEPANVLSRNASELTTREKAGARFMQEANKVNRIGKYNFSQLVQLSTEAQKAEIDKLQQPGDVQWGYKAIRGEVNVETDWNSYKNANSKDYSKWKSIYQSIFDKNFK